MLTIESSCPKGNSAKTSDLVPLKKKRQIVASLLEREGPGKMGYGMNLKQTVSRLICIHYQYSKDLT